jgi:Icc-related predicted phosphoesterase
MRVLASADVHGRLAVYEWLLTVARQHNVDAIVLAGDLLSIGSVSKKSFAHDGHLTFLTNRRRPM